MPDSAPQQHAASGGGRIIVTYSANTALLSSPLIPHFISSLSYQLPLRTLHWRPSQALIESTNRSSVGPSRSSQGAATAAASPIRTIQTLNVALRPLTDEIRRWRGDAGFFDDTALTGLLDRPFVHLYLVVCEDNDHYRTTVRNEIRSWISSLSFFHGKSAQASGSTGNGSASSSTPTSAPTRNSFGLGSFRTSTPPVRSESPASTVGTTTPTGTPTSGPRVTSLPPGPANQEPEYIIVVITPPEGFNVHGGATGSAAASAGSGSTEAKSGMGRFYSSSKSKSGVVEKIKADFNASKKEHVVHLTRLPPVPTTPAGAARPGAHAIDPTIWAELLVRLKESTSNTFTATLDAQQDEIRRCESGRGQGEWDFCTHFLAKDALAQTLEGVGLREDAVAQYEDLETTFEQAMLGGNVAFAPIGGDSRGDDSLPLLDVTKKPYHDLIRRREISLFDFRGYLFARRASLLGKLGRVVQVMREAPLFIGAMRRMLFGNPKVTKRMVESWSFSAALDVVEQCQAWLVERGDATSAQSRSRLEGRLAMAVTSSTQVEEQLSPVFHSAKADLLDLARRQLDKIGMAVGHLPRIEPFLLSADDDAQRPWARDLPPLPPDAEASASSQRDSDAQQITRPELQQAIGERDLFDSHYVSLVERIIVGLRNAGRKGSILRMQTLTAALDYHRQRFDKAYTALLRLPEVYHDQRWSSVESHLLARQLECHRQLGKPRDRAWVSVVLAALKACEGRPALPSAELDLAQASETRTLELWQDPRFLLQELRQAALSFEREIPVGGNRAFTIRPLSRRARLAGVEDGSTISVAVTSSLDFELAVEDVRLCFVGTAGQALWFTSGRTALKPSITELELFCSAPAHGDFVLDVSQIRLSRLIFQYAAAPHWQQNAVVPNASVLTIPKDGGAIDVDVDLPQEIHLERPREVELTLHSGRNHIESAEISIMTDDGEPLGNLSKAELVGTGSSARIERPRSAEGADNEGAAVTTTSIRITGQGAKTALRLRFPLTATSSDGGIDLCVVVQYIARPEEGARSNVRRILRKRHRLTISLPLGVNLQDYFRQTSILSKFIISAGGSGSLRIGSVRLAVDQHPPPLAEGEKAGSEKDADSKSGAEVGSELEVSPCAAGGTTTITPRQPASYLFRIQKRASLGAAESAAHRRLRLELHYRPLNEEARAIALSSLSRAIAALGEDDAAHLAAHTAERTLVERALSMYVDERLDLPAFALTGEVRTGPLDRAWWRHERNSWSTATSGGKKAHRQTIDLVASVLEAIADGTDEDLDPPPEDGAEPVPSSSTWRILTIPVDVPHLGLVNGVTLRARSTSSSVRAGVQSTATVGHPLLVDVTIRSSWTWCDPAFLARLREKGETCQRMVYDILPDLDGWIVAGSKRGGFDVPLPPPSSSSSTNEAGEDRETSEYNTTITLVPLKPGCLVLPNISVRPSAPASGGEAVEGEEKRDPPTCETFITNGAERIDVLPRYDLVATASGWVETTKQRLSQRRSQGSVQHALQAQAQAQAPIAQSQAQQSEGMWRPRQGGEMYA